MKWTSMIFPAAAVTLAAGVIIKTVHTPYDVAVVLQDNGLKSIKINKTEIIENGDFQVNKVLLRKPNGETYPGATMGTSEMDSARREVTKTYPWGTVKVNYAASRNGLTLTITTTNGSDTDTIQGLLLEPFSLRFPATLAEYDGTTPLLMHNIGDVASVQATYGSNKVVVVSDDVEKPLMIGFPWALDRPKNTIFPLTIHTDRVSNYPDSYPTIDRPIQPKGSDRYQVSLRFGRADASENDLIGDVYKKFAQVFPAQRKWEDRRPVGAIFLATPAEPWPDNPQGWFGDSHTNVNTASGRAEFHKRVLALADTAVSVMKHMNAQGAITWDVEGQRYMHATSYIGDPRVLNDLAPEMNEVADEYFARIRNAGLRVGVTVRPQQLVLKPDRKDATQNSVNNPAQLLIDKIAYAKKRWNATLFYIDSNASSTNSNPMDPAVLQKVAEAFPDVLLIPEHWTLRYYAFSAPYQELRRSGLGTSDAVRAVYPNAFSLIYTADGTLDLYQKRLARAVKQGDSLMYRTWYPDPQNEKVKTLFSR